MVDKYNKDSYSKNTFVVSVLGIAILIWIIFKVLFPVFIANEKTVDNFQIREINNRKYLELKIKDGYPFSSVDIKMAVSDNNGRSGGVFKNIYQDELGLYAVGKSITTQNQLDKFLKIESIKGLKNGELIKDGDSVYIISEGQRRAFSNAKVFDTLGFNWDKVQSDKEGLLGLLVKGKNITETTSYLPGSFVMTGKKVYLLGNEVKYPINNVGLIKDIQKYAGINIVMQDKLNSVGVFTCDDRKNQEIRCSFNDSEENVLVDAAVLIEVTGEFDENKWTSVVRTFNGMSSSVPIITMKNIKSRLLTRYAGRLGINHK